MLELMIVEDNHTLRQALRDGFNALTGVKVVAEASSGEEAFNQCLASTPQAILMDVQLAGEMNGIAAVVSIRRELPRLPVVIYSIQDDDTYYRDFQKSGILSHYAYVRKSNYLLPSQLLPLLKETIAGKGFIDPEIEARVHEVRYKDSESPMSMLEPGEQAVARMIGQGYTNEQIAEQKGFRDKRTISRINGQIYATWGLSATSTDEKIARTRAALIVIAGRLLSWGEDGNPRYLNENGVWMQWGADER